MHKFLNKLLIVTLLTVSLSGRATIIDLDEGVRPPYKILNPYPIHTGWPDEGCLRPTISILKWFGF